MDSPTGRRPSPRRGSGADSRAARAPIAIPSRAPRRPWDRDAVTRGDMQVARVHGVPVQVDNARPDIDTMMVLGRLERALALIARYDPRRMRHLTRDVSRIVVKLFPCRGAYFP